MIKLNEYYTEIKDEGLYKKPKVWLKRINDQLAESNIKQIQKDFAKDMNLKIIDLSWNKEKNSRLLKIESIVENKNNEKNILVTTYMFNVITHTIIKGEK